MRLGTLLRALSHSFAKVLVLTPPPILRYSTNIDCRESVAQYAELLVEWASKSKQVKN